MADIAEPRKPKSKLYRVIATGEVLPALRHPAGYEDDHPKDYEPYEEPAPEAAKLPASPAPQVAVVTQEAVHQAGAPITIAPLHGE